MPPSILVQANVARRFAQSILQAHGMSAAHARIVADCLVLADLRGIDTHGLNRLPAYLNRIRAGVLDPRAEPTVHEVTSVVAQIDARNGFSFVAGDRAIRLAIEMAREHGLGMVSVKHSNHLGMSAWVVHKALEANMISLVFTNASPTLPAWGGATPLLGTSPLACGAPAGETPAFVLDMATTVAARGKIQRAARRGEKIPTGWAVDRQGQPTEDPQVALGGLLCPIGGYKGAGLALMMDILGGVLSGSAFAGNVGGPDDVSKPGDVGHMFIVFRPNLFVSLKEFKNRMDHLYRTVVGSERLAGCDRIYYPGEMEQMTLEERRRTGIPYAMVEVEILNQCAEQAHVEALVSEPDYQQT